MTQTKFIRLFIIVLILVLGLAACSGKTETPSNEAQPVAPVATEAQPVAPSGGEAQPAAPAGGETQPAAPAQVAVDVTQLALPSGKVIERPTAKVTLDNVKTLDALGVWQLSAHVSNLLVAPDNVTVYATVGTPMTSAKGVLYRWRLDQSAPPEVIVETQGTINTLFFSPDGKYLIYGTQGNELVFYDLATNTPGQNLLGTGRGVTAAALSPTEGLLAWGLFEDYPYYLYLNGSQTSKFGYRLGTVLDMAFSPDGKEVFMAREDGSLFVVDASGWQLLKSIPIGEAGKERLGWMELSPDGSLLAVTGMDMGTMWVVDSSSWKPVVTLQGGPGLNKGAFSPDGQMVLIGNNNNSVSVLSLPIKNFTGAVKLADSPVISVAFTPDGTLVLIGDRNGQVRLLAPPSMVNLQALPPTATP